MTADVALQRLAGLRRIREQRALEALLVQAGQLRAAEQQAQAAEHAVQRHVDAACATERELISALAGRAVSHAAIISIQMELDGAALETAQLRSAAAGAQANLLNQQNARAEASATFRLRRRAAAKLALVCDEQGARRSRWHAALNEAEDEDRNATTSGGPPP